MKKNRKQYLVVGLGRFGSAVAQTLAEEGCDVLGVDRDMNVVESHRSLLTEAVCTDGMDRQALEMLGAADFDVAIISIGANFSTAGVVTMHLKEMGVKFIIAKAYDEFQGRMLTKLGADKVIFPERDMAQRIAFNLISERIIDFIEVSPDYSLMEVKPKKEWIGKSLRELDLRKKESVNIIAVRDKDGVNAMPDADTQIHETDRLLLIMQNPQP